MQFTKKCQVESSFTKKTALSKLKLSQFLFMNIHKIMASCAIFSMLACQSPQSQSGVKDGLLKVRYEDESELESLRQSGAQIIVKEKDYVVVRLTSEVAVQNIVGEKISESDLVQRLVYIALKDSGDVQKIVDTGLDLWEVKGDTAIARAFDLYIEELRKAGFFVKVVEENAGMKKGEQE